MCLQGDLAKQDSNSNYIAFYIQQTISKLMINFDSCFALFNDDKQVYESQCSVVSPTDKPHIFLQP